MPQNITIAAFVLGAVLLLISLLGGGFKIFGAEVSSSVNKLVRVIAFIFGSFFLFVGLFNPFERTVVPSPQPVPTPTSASPVSPQPTASIARINISGVWRDPSGGVSHITQQGDAFQLTIKGIGCLGSFESSGGGTMRGNSFEMDYQSNYSRGRCQGTVSPDGMQMTSTCFDSACGQFQTSSQRQREDGL